jgi:purine-nucleoside phosphorylase
MLEFRARGRLITVMMTGMGIWMMMIYILSGIAKIAKKG